MSTNEKTGPTGRRRERPAQPALTRQGIIDVALTILRDEGLSKVTMRRIAAALDTGAASLYVYVRNTEDLHAQLLDALLGSVGGSLPAAETWRARLKAQLWSYMLVLFDHPEIARMTLTTHPSGPNYMKLVEALLALLHEGGVSDQASAWGVDIVLLFATAVATEQSTRRALPQGADDFSALTAAITTANAEVYPQIARLGSQLLSGPGPARFDWALDVLLDGMLANAHTPADRKKS